MSYRDDVDALFHRARTLQAEVDRLRTELDQRSSAAPRARVVDRTVWLPERPHHEPQAAIDALLHRLETAATTPLPEQRDRPRPPAPPPVPTEAPDPEFGVLVARLSAVEHVLVVRLLELLGDDDFSPAGVHANQAAFDQLVIELRQRLAG